MLDIPKLRQELLNKESFNQVVLDHIYTQNWLNIWVPKQYNGLGLHFSEGLKVLQSVAKIDGSLGWFVTLCSGANYFSRNLKPDVASNLFSSQKTCFGGSGMLGGTAEKVGCAVGNIGRRPLHERRLFYITQCCFYSNLINIVLLHSQNK